MSPLPYQDAKSKKTAQVPETVNQKSSRGPVSVATGPWTEG